MSLLDMIPGVAAVKSYAIVILIATIGGSFLWLKHSNVTLKAAVKTEQQGRADDNTKAVAAAATETIVNLAEGARRQAAQKDSQDETQRLASRARADALAAVRDDPRLRAAFSAATPAPGRCAGPGDPGAVAVGQAASASGGSVQSDVFGELDDRAGRLAAALDDAYIAGRGCEREHDSLKPPVIELGRMKFGEAFPVLPARND